MERCRKISKLFSIVGLLLILTGVTYSFFNYIRTGGANTVSVGRVSFVTRQTETINLTNVFPIDRANVDTDTNNVDEVVIEIEGDTDYENGIEYLVSSVDSNIYSSTGQTIPIGLDITVEDLGTSNTNYFTARENTNTSIYKRLVGDTLVGDGMLLVGYIIPNTTAGTAEGIDGSITIKAFFDKDTILVSDTYDGTESDNMGTTNSKAEGKTVLTTTEWNNLQTNGVSFKIKVEANEGIWVTGSLEEIMKKTTVMDNIASTYVSASTGIDFGAISSDTNGKGVYTRAGTETDDYPIMYYRGDIDDNNVIFGNNCWKAVRTTDTGGVKLIYNGIPLGNKASLSESEYGIPLTNNGFTFDVTDNSWNAIMITNITSSEPYEISFNVPDGDGYVMNITGVSTTTGGVSGGIYRGGTQINGFGGGSGSIIQLTHTLGTLTSNSTDTIKVTYYVSGGNSTSESPSTLKIILSKRNAQLGIGCDNIESDTAISTTGSSFNLWHGSDLSPAYNGYMYGTVYEISSSNWTSDARFGSGFTWDGTYYHLIDDSVTTPNATHHYSCNVTVENGTCTQLRYVFFKSGSTKYYVTLTGGDGVEEALKKMNLNTNSSSIKTIIDTWYESNLSSYTNQLEDTIWCNDRSFGSGNNNGWIATGGSLSTHLYYGPLQRSNNASNASSVKNQPDLVCINKNDRFTVHNGNGNQALLYPIALLTSDEVTLAGGVAGKTNSLYYLNSLINWWTLSPYNFSYGNGAGVFDFITFIVSFDGSLAKSYTSGLIRPAISIKPGQLIIKGTGTVTDPYVIE